MPWVLSMAAGKEWNLVGQSCDPRQDTFCRCAWPLSSTAAASISASPIPINDQSPTRGGSGLRDPHAFTHQLSHMSSSTCTFLSFLELSSIFSHFLGACICSYWFMSPPRWTKKRLQFSLYKPDLSVGSFAAGSQFSLSDSSLLPAASRSQSVQSVYHLPPPIATLACGLLLTSSITPECACLSLSQNIIHRDTSFSSLKAAYGSAPAITTIFFFLVN